ncbi:MAG: cytochrome b5-like heme/steroid binding domain-containing protein [Patescibacteria group bacterium]
MKTLGLWLLIVIVLGGGIWWYSSSQSTTEPQDTNQEQSTETTNADQFTITQIAEHNSSDSCWMTIEGKVYDVTEAISGHPGGEFILRGCGIDATELFNNRPGEGTPHSSAARAGLENFEIGVLAN